MFVGIYRRLRPSEVSRMFGIAVSRRSDSVDSRHTWGRPPWTSSFPDNSIYAGSACIRVAPLFQTIAANSRAKNQSCSGVLAASDARVSLAVILAGLFKPVEYFFFGVWSKIWHFVFPPTNK
jgi:hypothetical protein